MKYLVIWTFAVKQDDCTYNINYRSEVFTSVQNILAYGACSIRFRNLGTTNLLINSEEPLYIGESIAYNNLPDCKITQNFKIQELV